MNIQIQKFYFWNVLILLGFSLPAFCADIILSPPEKACWSVSFFSDAGPVGAPPISTEASPLFPQKIRFTKTGNIGKAEKIFSDRNEVEYAQAAFYFKRDDQKRPILVPAGFLGFTDETFLIQFPDVSWVRPNFLIGPMSVGEEPCMYFRRTYQEDSDSMNPTPETITQEAWFSTKSRLPIASRSKGITRFYNFESPPVTNVQLPSEFQKILDIYHRPPP